MVYNPDQKAEHTTEIYVEEMALFYLLKLEDSMHLHRIFVFWSGLTQYIWLFIYGKGSKWLKDRSSFSFH